MTRALTHTEPCPTCGQGRPVPIAGALRRARKAAGMTQRQIAERLDLSPQYISDIEAGRRPCPPRVLAVYMGLGP